MNCIHCGQSSLPVESYRFSCETPSQEPRTIELVLCLNCLSEIRLDSDLQLVSAGKQIS